MKREKPTRKISRSAYIKGVGSHADYYGQFFSVKHAVHVVMAIGMARVANAGPNNLHRIPLGDWESVPLEDGAADLLREAGDSPSTSGLVNINKCAARFVLLSKQGELS